MSWQATFAAAGAAALVVLDCTGGRALQRHGRPAKACEDAGAVATAPGKRITEPSQSPTAWGWRRLRSSRRSGSFVAQWALRGDRMRPLHAAVGLLHVLLLEATSTAAEECGVLGDAASFRVGAGGSGCVICGDGNGAPCPAPSSTTPAPPPPDEPNNAQGPSVCYALAAHPTNMALSGDEDVEVHRIPGCSCHASCTKCGYAAMPTEETQCIGALQITPYAGGVTLVATVDWLLTERH